MGNTKQMDNIMRVTRRTSDGCCTVILRDGFIFSHLRTSLDIVSCVPFGLQSSCVLSVKLAKLAKMHTASI